jgi:hypothetical protein
MSSVVISGNTSGTITLDAPAVAGTTTLTLPATSGTVIVNSGAQTIEFADGSAGAPSITNSGDTNTGMFFPAADTIAFAEGGTEAMRLDSSGNVAIGATSAINSGTRVTVNGTNQIVDSFGLISVLTTNSQAANLGGQIGLGGSFSGTTQTVFGAIAGRKESSTNAEAKGYLQFSTLENSVQERMRINSNGNIVQTSGIGISYAGISGTNFIGFKWTSPNVIARIDNVLDVTLANVSDYRIKRNIQTQTTPALERVMALRPVTYQMADYGTLFKASDDIKEGFIAHEVQEVIPSGADGMKDDENQIQTLRSDAILSVAIKAIQEQQTIINAIKAELDNVKTELATLKGAAQ